MTRDPNTPIILWICAAVCAHYVAAQGADYVADWHQHRTFLAIMGAHARDHVRGTDQVFEVSSLNEEEELAKDEPAEKPEPSPVKPPDPEAAEKKPDPPKPEPEKKVAVVIKPTEEAAKPPEPAQLLDDKRIAVRQHAKPDQEDNPTARFIGDEANHVEQETVATLTSHDQDDPNPTPGGNHSGAPDRTGDSERTRIAESDNHDGEKNRAPGEKGNERDLQDDPTPLKNPGPVAIQAPPSNQSPRSGGDNQPPKASPATTPNVAGGAPPSAPEVAQAPAGSWSFNPIRQGEGAQAAHPGTTGDERPQSRPGSTKWLGLGGRTGPGMVNLNLTTQGVAAVVGQDQLRKERQADGERRRSEHRGSWVASSFERWRSAIENYVSTVKPGNQTALNTAAVPFASYLNGMHNRIHPIFADAFLDSLGALPKTHPMNNPKMFTRLEIVVTPEGRLVKMGVVKTSGITAFDLAALDSVHRAQPFGPAPKAIISTDGNVYLHWEFHRDEVYACSTLNARPFLLNVPAKPSDPDPKVPSPGTPSQERGAPPPVNLHEMREGALPVRTRFTRARS